ncbi:UDP-2,4-diacetamido-2,4,6-trideoxy-beta-L-altropyranose hydrolase [Pseudomonas sp. 102515]|uniref:UDP-2,4-diacetamido-2,4, 6-trideoxy-beta-L-altropyranose hydrolase n=1 Tax=Pseudomonas sp. 102515 TaxID=3071568 RepID=UPI0028009B37|nr:UDP-2,4-diacetamido-2,4,6-trideoxy-beta-L-altropyranose hydrolase [Pseudomonas sp. 102515]MDQ7912465.1 UDP-2,4-diacetamido-2,4,6-trideoxy-beta-L-altropyranose hydrolase [Pseudomonas sp. 102515]
MRILVRVDASPVIGSGHLTRCLTLARALEVHGAQFTFVCRLAEPAWRVLIPQAYEVLLLPPLGLVPGYPEQRIDAEEDFLATQALLGERRFDWCLVDHYGLAADWHVKARRHASRILVLDDLANRPLDCDLLLDQGDHPYPERRYVSLLQRAAGQLFGPDHALLRDEFRQARQSLAPRSGRLERILVFFTGGDDLGQTRLAVQALLDRQPTLTVDVVVGAGQPDQAELQVLCNRPGWRLHIQIDYMARLLSTADLAIGAAGASSWERCALGVPALLAILSDNQHELAVSLERRGAALILGEGTELGVEDYRQALQTLTPEHLARLSAQAWKQVDGLGTQRVVHALMNLSAAH